MRTKVIKDLNSIINNQQILIQKLFDICDWSISVHKKVMRTETDNYYLKWKVNYLEKKIREHFKKNGPLAEEHPMSGNGSEPFEKLKQDGIKQHSESDKETE